MAASDAADYAIPAADGGVGGGAVEPGVDAHGGSALRFLQALFGAKPAEFFILVWLLATKKSKWFRNAEGAAQYVAEHRHQDLYVGVAASPADFGPSHRCPAQETAGIFAVWVDIDHQSEAHKKQNLPPALEDALSLLPPDLPPSIIVHSGHGAQAWWIFSTPWLFHSGEDRAAAVQVVRAFNHFFQAKAAAKGWEVDSTWDLARVMRIPGTTNTKVPGDHRPVKLVELNDRLYTSEEIRDYLDCSGVSAPVQACARPASPSAAPASAIKSTASMPAVADFVLNPNAEPPFEKFEFLRDIERRFGDTWNRKRPDLKDKSPSAYDQSLANFAAMARWTNQEIVNLLIAHRRKHGDDLKLRVDYFQMTIAKACAAAEEFWKNEKADEAFTQLLAEADDDDQGGSNAAGGDGEREATSKETPATASAAERSVTPERRKTVLRTLSTKFKVPLKRIVKFTGDDPRYRLETELGDVQLGNVNGLIGQSKLRSSIAAATGKYLPHFDPDLWPGVARLLLEACEEVDRGRDATLIGTMTEWLRAYLRHKQPHESLAEADEGREPFTHNGAVYIFIDNLRHWLGVQQGEKVTRNMLTADLRAFGAEPEPFDLEVKDKRTTRSAWKLPAGMWEPEPQPTGSAD
jgi:hypothetical protein